MLRLPSLPVAPDTNPDVSPTTPFSHSAFYSLALLALTWAGEQLALYQDPPSWTKVVLLALPWIKALLSKKSYRA